MAITTGPKPQNLVQLEAIRAELEEHAELATDANGVIDRSKLPPATREIFDSVAGRGELPFDFFSKRLEVAADRLDRADTGGEVRGRSGGEYPDPRGLALAASKRRAKNDAKEGGFPLLPWFRHRFVPRNMVIDPPERAQLEAAHDVPALGVLRAADEATKEAAQALAQKHFKGPQVLHRDYWDYQIPDEFMIRREYAGFVRGGPGSLAGIESVMVKHHDSGKWFIGKVKEDGSYEVPLGKNEGDLSIWYQTTSGDRFKGGRVALGNGTRTDDLGGSPLSSGQSYLTSSAPLAFAPRVSDTRSTSAAEPAEAEARRLAITYSGEFAKQKKLAELSDGGNTSKGQIGR